MRLIDADRLKKSDKNDIAFALWIDNQPTALDIRSSVLRFAAGMEAKLQRDDAVKPSWSEQDIEELRDALFNELEELDDALYNLQQINDFKSGKSKECTLLLGGTNEGVAQECYDVANFAMMIADVVQGLGQNRGRE